MIVCTLSLTLLTINPNPFLNPPFPYLNPGFSISLYFSDSFQDNGSKNFELGQCSMLTSADQVRFKPRSSNGEDVICFAVGKPNLQKLGAYFKNFTEPITKEKKKWPAGANFEPIW